jgi:hypothetical protein
MRAGLKRSQTSSVPLYERTKLFRGYENTVLPGLFHTAEYATAILQFWNEFLDLSSDIDEAVATRMERQRILYTGNRRFAFILEEQTLRTRVGGTDVMLGQLDRMLAIMSLPRISLGIIPATAQRYCLTQGSFWIFDEDRVQVEGVSAGLDITQPREIAVHVKAFALLQKSALYGPAAREVVHRALAELRDEGWRGTQAVSFSAHIAATRAVRLTVTTETATGSPVSTHDSDPVTPGVAGAGTQLTLTPPATAAVCRVAVTVPPGTASTVTTAAWQLEAGAAPTPWRPGGGSAVVLVDSLRVAYPVPGSYATTATLLEV